MKTLVKLGKKEADEIVQRTMSLTGYLARKLVVEVPPPRKRDPETPLPFLEGIPRDLRVVDGTSCQTKAPSNPVSLVTTPSSAVFTPVHVQREGGRRNLCPGSTCSMLPEPGVLWLWVSSQQEGLVSGLHRRVDGLSRGDRGPGPVTSTWRFKTQVQVLLFLPPSGSRLPAPSRWVVGSGGSSEGKGSNGSDTGFQWKTFQNTPS